MSGYNSKNKNASAGFWAFMWKLFLVLLAIALRIAVSFLGLALIFCEYYLRFCCLVLKLSVCVPLYIMDFILSMGTKRSQRRAYRRQARREESIRFNLDIIGMKLLCNDLEHKNRRRY